LLTVIVCGIMFSFAIIFAPGSGVYTLDFIDQFSANYTLLIVAFFECVAISWFYGLARYYSFVTFVPHCFPYRVLIEK